MKPKPEALESEALEGEANPPYNPTFSLPSLSNVSRGTINMEHRVKYFIPQAVSLFKREEMPIYLADSNKCQELYLTYVDGTERKEVSIKIKTKQKDTKKDKIREIEREVKEICQNIEYDFDELMVFFPEEIELQKMGSGDLDKAREVLLSAVLCIYYEMIQRSIDKRDYFNQFHRSCHNILGKYNLPAVVATFFGGIKQTLIRKDFVHILSWNIPEHWDIFTVKYDHNQSEISANALSILGNHLNRLYIEQIKALIDGISFQLFDIQGVTNVKNSLLGGIPCPNSTVLCFSCNSNARDYLQSELTKREFLFTLHKIETSGTKRA